MKYKSVIISGQIASGTTTAAQNVAQKLNLKFESAGDFFRKYALQSAIPLYDKEKIPDSLDQEIDTKLTKLAKSGGYSIDAHYIGYLTKDDPQVLRILLTCDQAERFRRAKVRRHTHVETFEEIKKREEGLDKKFRKLYADENYMDPKFFSLVIDTTNISPEETTQKILEKFSTT